MIQLWINDQIRLPDGREATVCYHGLDGDGIKFGLHDIPLEDLEDTCPVFKQELPPEHPARNWTPDAILREKDYQKYCSLPCVGIEFEIIRKCSKGIIVSDEIPGDSNV